MPTLEERLTALEQSQLKSGEGINDLNHYVTTLVGIVQKQEWEIREIKNFLRTLTTDVQVLGQNIQITTQNSQALRQEVQSLRQEGQSLRQELQGIERNMNSRFGEQDKKFDQILLLLNTLADKSDQQA